MYECKYVKQNAKNTQMQNIHTLEKIMFFIPTSNTNTQKIRDDLFSSVDFKIPHEHLFHVPRTIYSRQFRIIAKRRRQESTLYFLCPHGLSLQVNMINFSSRMVMLQVFVPIRGWGGTCLACRRCSIIDHVYSLREEGLSFVPTRAISDGQSLLRTLPMWLKNVFATSSTSIKTRKW